MSRLDFYLSEVSFAINGDLRLDDLYDYVSIDKKWFYLIKVTKVFMAAVARPRYDAHRRQYFNGKIGIWPFIYQEPAQKNSKNRAKGTITTKNVESVTAVHCKNMIM